MAQIKQFNITHYKKVQKMISSISEDEKISFFATIFGGFTDLFQNFMPLSLRKSPESYIVINETNDVKAFITIETTKGNRKKWYIKRLFLDKNSFDEGKQLIGYVVAKYGALGADTFCVLIDENDDTSAQLFSKRCGFRLCSREVIWKSNSDLEIETNYSEKDFIKFSNKYSKKVADFYNESISSHFRYSLEKETSEFRNRILGNSQKEKTEKYIIKNNDNSLLAYFEIQTYNENDKVIDLIVSKPFENEYLPILKAITNKIKNDSNIFILNRNYMSCAKIFEELLEKNNFERSQTKMLFVKDFYKPLKNEEPIVNPAVIFNEISGKPAFILTERLQKSD